MKKPIELEQYYPGDDAWRDFTAVFTNKPSDELVQACNGDHDLAKVIDYYTEGLNYLNCKVPALDKKTPKESLNDENLMRRLRTLIMRMH